MVVAPTLDEAFDRTACRLT